MTQSGHWRLVCADCRAGDTRILERTAPDAAAFFNQAGRYVAGCARPRSFPQAPQPQDGRGHTMTRALAANRPDFAVSTRRRVCSGIIQMREYSEYVACPCCGETMQLARTATHEFASDGDIRM